MISSSCPIWDSVPDPHEINPSGTPYASSRAGGRFTLVPDALPLLSRLQTMQKTHLSYWIFDHNRRYRLFEEHPDPIGFPVLNAEWIKAHADRGPSMEDRLLAFMREVIRQWDKDQRRRYTPQSDEYALFMAASGCHKLESLREFWDYAEKKGWIELGPSAIGQTTRSPMRIDLSARMFVEAQGRETSQSRQGFVAMWFNPSLAAIYEQGIAPGIEDAGYAPLRIDQQDPREDGTIDDAIIAEIRRSRFLVADFTHGTKGHRGSVYYEAGFAHGLGIPRIFTCRKDLIDSNALAFDVNHYFVLDWLPEQPAALRKRLCQRIWALTSLGEGPGLQAVDSTLI